jgi:hypothetical protein
LTLTGTNGRLTAWGAGNRVAIDSVLGNPDGIGLFGSVVRVVQDRIIFGDDRIAPGEFATIGFVPEPSTGVLLTAFVAVAIVRGRLGSVRSKETGHFEDVIQIGEWTTYDKHGEVYKVTKMKPKE